MLVCAVERGENVIIPYGSTCLMAGDNISVIVDKSKIKDTLKKLGYEHREVKNVMIVGGKRIGYYTAEALDREGLNVKIIENNRERCEELDELLPHVTIINGDATDKQLLSAEGIKNADAFIAATGIDEENIFLTMFAREMSDAKCVSKVDRLAFDNILDKLDIDSVVYPNFITADYIMQYVRSIQNFAGNSVATLYRLIGNKVEALEFNVHENSPVINKPLRELELKKDLLVCSINRGGKVIVPGGNDCIEKGDSVVIVTLQTGLSDIRDILRD
jgi:trk system potassium uptake protein TrkA